MHIRCWPLVCMRSVCSNEPSTTSALPPIRFCSAAVPDAKLVGSTVSPSCSKYFLFSATKYAILFIWLTEPPTESAMRGFSRLGACPNAGVATTSPTSPAAARQPIRFISFLRPRFLVAASVSGQVRRHKRLRYVPVIHAQETVNFFAFRGSPSNSHLILRRARSARLEGSPQASRCPPASFETRSFGSLLRMRAQLTVERDRRRLNSTGT